MGMLKRTTKESNSYFTFQKTGENKSKPQNKQAFSLGKIFTYKRAWFNKIN